MILFFLKLKVVLFMPMVPGKFPRGFENFPRVLGKKIPEGGSVSIRRPLSPDVKGRCGEEEVLVFFCSGNPSKLFIKKCTRFVADEQANPCCVLAQ